MKSKMAGPPDKNRSKEKLSSEKSDKKYATLTTRSIALMAESAGYPSISGEICTILAQDICYRLRETAQVKCLCTISGQDCCLVGPITSDFELLFVLLIDEYVFSYFYI